jgi:hypothetical protein
MKDMSTHPEGEKDMACSAVLRSALVFLLVSCTVAVLFVGAVRAYSTATLRHPMQTILIPLRSTISNGSTAGEDGSGDALEPLGIDGDRGLGAAAEVKRNLATATHYTIHLRLADGADQLIVVTAPPGGLQFEVRDMTGDNVRNDLVLRPALVHWPLIVLLNDGHDHFTVAISATLPSSLDSRKRASGTQVPENVVLASSGSRTSPLTNIKQRFVTNLLKNFFAPIAQSVRNGTAYMSVSGRAPPTIAATI